MRLPRQQLRIAMWLDSPLQHKEIATLLGMNMNLYKTHCKRLYRALDVQDRVGAVKAFERLT